MESESLPPAANELEVSLFGPGYGESVIVHIGNGQWIVVDSCLGQSGGEPAALHYFSEIGCDVEHSVLLVVITHWHDDHVRGLREVVKRCKAAKIAVSAAFQQEEFLALPAIFSQRALPETGLDELAEVFRILQERHRGPFFEPPMVATQDRLLLKAEIPLDGSRCPAMVYALSPSDRAILQACSAFAALNPVIGEPPKRIAPPSQNDASVVLWVEVGDHKVLLGADLQNDPSIGWSVLIDNSSAISGKAEVFKVSHHGAESGHEPRVWSELLSPNPTAVLCPWSLAGNLLPTDSDSERIKSLTSDAYITAPPVARHRFHLRENKVRRMVEDATRSIQETALGWGHVRLRRSLSDARDGWRVELFGEARRLA